MFSQFDQVEYCNVDSDNLDRYCFILLEFVVGDFLSNKALLLPDLYKKFEDLVDKTALIKSLKEPEDKIGEPSPIRGNKFSHLSLEDFKETGDETFAWESFEKKLSAYSFLKYLVQENDIHVDLPGLMTFLSFSETDTEKSEFCSIEVLDETADSKATVLKTLNILHKKFQIGIKLQYQVVVGDRKSYDHLIILYVYLLKSLYEWFLFVHNFSMIVNFYDLFLVEMYRKIKINFYLLCLIMYK